MLRTSYALAMTVLLVISLGGTSPSLLARPAEGEPPATVLDPDSDGDGLSDFQEVHKYCTNPTRKDTEGRGTPDGDWKQRREFTYSVRAVIRILPPYNLKAMNDDYQDVRVLAETPHHAELEIVSYPLNTNADAISPNPNWKRDYAGMKEYLAPGLTTNWDAAMRDDLLRDLARAGIDPERLNDKDVVENVSAWLWSASKHQNMFCTYYIHYPDGKPAILPGLERQFEADKGDKAWSVPEQLAHELLGKEMFARKTYGTCTSAAVYQCTVLRALGIPTRMILAIPLVDASDPAQVALVEKLQHHGVRGAVRRACLALGNSFAAHTYCEVYVGHRWRRLNYGKLGQNVLDPGYMGLMLHVHTFRDLSDANLAGTWGKRYALHERDDVFRQNNPYQTVELGDHFGKHGRVPNPPAAEKEHRHITISKAYWFDSKDTPELVRTGAPQPQDGSGQLFIHGEEWFDNAGDYLQYKAFMKQSDRQLVLRAPGRQDVKGHVSMTFFTHASRNIRELEVLIPPEELAKMAKGVPYTLHPANGNPGYVWRVKEGVTITRP
jgi:hypothetical protein